MMKKIVTIEEIKANPNLDLTERIAKFSQDKRWTSDDLEELALASIKREYEYWINKRTNISERTDAMLVEILNGHIINNIEGFEMICDDPQKLEQYAKCETLRQKINDNNGITHDDFDELCTMIGFDSDTTQLIRQGFESNGLIIDEYKTDDLHQK